MADPAQISFEVNTDGATHQRFTQRIPSGLTYNQNKPRFLQNIGTALSGPSTSNNSDRPLIPTRPDDDPNGDAPSDEDAYDLGEEAPQVVVLKEGKHLTKAEFDAAKQDAPTAPTTTTGTSQAARKDASLRFSSGKSGPKGKRKIQTMDDVEGAEDEEGTGSFGDLVKRTKTETASIPSKSQESEALPERAESVEKEEQKKKAPLTKEEKAAMKAKRKAAKKMLSFED